MMYGRGSEIDFHSLEQAITRHTRDYCRAPYDIDMTAGKAFTLTVCFKLPFYVQAFNLFNQTQWLGGRIDDVAPIEYTESERSILEP